MNWELQLTRPVRTHRSDLPEIIRTLGDAVDMIDEHLPETPNSASVAAGEGHARDGCGNQNGPRCRNRDRSA
jgi:hypothetical protein